MVLQYYIAFTRAKTVQYWPNINSPALIITLYKLLLTYNSLTCCYLISFLLRYNWFYHTLPQANMDNRVMYWPRGRVWGGSSSLNAMVYIRGHAEDYNRWQREGADGWDYDHCLPYFRKAQCHELGENR